MHAVKFSTWLVLVILPSLAFCRPIWDERTIVDMTHTFDDTTLGFVYDTPFKLTITQKGITKDGYW